MIVVAHASGGWCRARKLTMYWYQLDHQFGISHEVLMQVPWRKVRHASVLEQCDDQVHTTIGSALPSTKRRDPNSCKESRH